MKQLGPKDEYLELLLKKVGYSKPISTNRASIDDTFMRVALEVAKRSSDAQTKVGAVVVSPTNRILSTGYNGFPRDIDYSQLPNTRPDKYPWMMHAEFNSIAWCEHRPVDCTVYCTHKSCNNCMLTAWQFGITTIVEPHNIQTHGRKPEDDQFREIFLHLSGMTIQQVNISHLLDGV